MNFRDLQIKGILKPLISMLMMQPLFIISLAHLTEIPSTG